MNQNTTTAPINYRDIITNPRVHVSNGNSKTGAIPAFNTLPTGGIITMKDGRAVCNINGTCAGVCDGCERFCYAVSSVKRYPTAARAWAENTLALRLDIKRVRAELRVFLATSRPRYFRIHVSGEFDGRSRITARNEFLMWAQFADEFEDTVFYLYTKRFDLVAWYTDRFDDLPANLVINKSLVDEMPPEGSRGKYFITDSGSNPEVAKFPHCPAILAPENGSKYGKPNHSKTCEFCGLCMNRKIRAVAVYLHL